MENLIFSDENDSNNLKSKIILTEEQKRLFNYMLDQAMLGSNGENVVVSAIGGSGKTTLLTELVIELIKTGLSVCVGCMTAKATSVVRQKVFDRLREELQNKDSFIKEWPSKQELYIDTIQKITKESKVVNIGKGGKTQFVNNWRNPKHFSYKVFIIDELSMVPSYISLWWRMTNARVFGFGDCKQLPEVLTSDSVREHKSLIQELNLSPESFIPKYGVTILDQMQNHSLSKVLRADNLIVNLTNELRDFTLTKDATVKIIKSYAEKADYITYQKEGKNLSSYIFDPTWQYITYTNKTCDLINNKLCAGGDEYPLLTDKILLMDNINPYKLYNGDVLNFGDFLSRITIGSRKAEERGLPKSYVVMKWKGRMPEINPTNPIETMFAINYREFSAEIKQVSRRRMKELPAAIKTLPKVSEEQKEQWINEVKLVSAKQLEDDGDDGEKFVKIMNNLNIYDPNCVSHLLMILPPLPKLFVVEARYGFAITVHKSQGSEYPKVAYVYERHDKPLNYTALSRAKKELKIIDIT